MEFTLQNHSDKTITAIKAKAGRISVVQDLTDRGDYIRPGGEHIWRVTVPGGSRFDVATVIFEDSSFVGDSSFARNLALKRRGERDQYLRIRRILRIAMTNGDSLVAVANHIRDLSETSGSEHYRAGLHSAKTQALWDLGDAQESAGPRAQRVGSSRSIGDVVSGLDHQCADRIARIKASIGRR
jgi:hypothetical protein